MNSILEYGLLCLVCAWLCDTISQRKKTIY